MLVVKKIIQPDLIDPSSAHSSQFLVVLRIGKIHPQPCLHITAIVYGILSDNGITIYHQAGDMPVLYVCEGSHAHLAIRVCSYFLGCLHFGLLSIEAKIIHCVSS